jgi:hypothetical protein
MNVKQVWTKGRWYLLVAVAALIAGAALVFLLGGGSLSAKLAETKRSLADAQSVNRLVTSSNLELQQQLDDATQLLTADQQLLAELRGQAQIEQSGLDAIASSVQTAGGDLYSRALAIASGFDKLYEVYHGGATASGGP